MLKEINYTKKYIRLSRILFFAVLSILYLIHTFYFYVNVHIKIKVELVNHSKNRNIVRLIRR